jgi:hypothetical protein
MPPSGERSNRKGQYSCNFCRTRKLRCDRPLPCTSCRSRGKTCQFEPTPAERAHGAGTPMSMEQSKQDTPLLSSTSGLTAEQSVAERSYIKGKAGYKTVDIFAGQVNLLAELHALQRQTRDLEKRIVGNAPTTSQQWSPPTSISTSSRDEASIHSTM